MSKSKSRSRSRSSSFSKPSWLLSTIVDLDERTKMLALNNDRTSRRDEEEEEVVKKKAAVDSFAERAEDYYLKRPQLLTLLQDLYNGYLSLADRYCQTLAKHQHRRQHSCQSTALNFQEQVDSYEEEEEEEEEEYDDLLGVDSDAESSLSYQTPIVVKSTTSAALQQDGDAIVAELVMKAVDYNILMNEVSLLEVLDSRKTELQKSLVEVLESERLILLNENARLGYRVTALVEENRGLAAETLFMKRKAGELAGCVLEMREDHRVCMLSRKIEDLQGQIYGLERTRNKEYYDDQLVTRDNRHYQGGGGGGEEKTKKAKSKKKKKKKKKSKGGGEVTLEDCFQVNGEEDDIGSCTGTAVGSSTKKGLVDHHAGGGRRKVVSKWWDRVKNFDLFLCGPHNPNFTFC